MEKVLDQIDRFKTPITVLLVAAILTAGGVLLTRSYQLQAVLQAQAATDAEGAELTSLRERQQALLAELEQLRSQAALSNGTDQGSIAPAGSIATPNAGGATEATDDMVRLNSADRAALETLPGIGASKAAAIIAYRVTNGPFTSVDELDNVKGIGPATVDKLRPYLTLD